MSIGISTGIDQPFKHQQYTSFTSMKKKNIEIEIEILVFNEQIYKQTTNKFMMNNKWIFFWEVWFLRSSPASKWGYNRCINIMEFDLIPSFSSINSTIWFNSICGWRIEYQIDQSKGKNMQCAIIECFHFWNESIGEGEREKQR